MFGYYCIIAAAYLLGCSIKEYRFIAFAVFLEFLLHKLAFNHLFLEYRAEDKSLIFYIYASIQLPVIYLLAKIKSHFVISGLIFINMIYNLSIPFTFKYETFINIYLAKDYFIGTIMIMELIYLGLLSQHARNYITKRWSVDGNYIDSVFCVRGWNLSRRMA